MRSNTSGYIGVSLKKSKGLYQARAYMNRRPIHLGYFSDPIEAAKVRDKFVSKHYISPTLNFRGGTDDQSHLDAVGHCRHSLPVSC